MRLTARLLLGACVLVSVVLAGERGAPPRPRLLITPAPVAEWKAPIQDVQHVLYSAARELWRFFPQEKVLAPIVVAPRGGPIVWYRRGLNGEYYVQLATGSTYWAQYAFQFAHEFCHILCGYTAKEKANKWFEESLCELASLFALRRMAETWAKKPPYPNWRSFAPNLASYAENRMKGHRLPPGKTLAQWYRENEAALRKNATDRERNLVVATALLPLFEAQPEHWPAVESLNAGASGQQRSFAEYLADWHRNAPAKHRQFIATIASRFGICVAPR